MRTNRMLKLRNNFAGSIANIYMNAARFHWKSAFINDCVVEVWKDELYRKLPRHAQAFIEGIRYHCGLQHWKLVEFSYFVRGERLTLSSEKYRATSPQYIHEKCSETGCFVYKDSPENLFTEPSEKTA